MLIRVEGSADWHTPSNTTSAKECQLQRLIVDSPSLLPGVNERPTAVADEVRMPGAGRADVVVVDAEGEITIVECKLAANPEIRRWVIGQVFSYAAGLWKLDYEDFERSFAARGRALTKPFKDLPGWEKETFRSTVSRNLAAGAFRLIIAVDEITEELKRTVAFLHSHTLAEVLFLALELRHSADEGIQAPVREVYGENSAEIGPLRPTWKPDRWTLLGGTRTADGARVANDLLDWAESKSPRLSVRYTPTDCVIETPGGTLFRIREHREVRVSFGALTAHGEPWDEERTKQFVQDLDEIGVRLERNRPRAPLESLADEGKRKEFLALMERVLTLTG